MADLTVVYTLTTPGPDIIFNSGPLGDGVDKYWIDSIQGLDGPAIRAPVDLVPFGDGGIVHTFRLGPRRIIMEGMLLLDPPTLVDCQERRNDLRDDLLSALASIVTASGTLAWTDTGASSLLDPRLQRGRPERHVHGQLLRVALLLRAHLGRR